MSEFETATNDPISFEEYETLIRLIITDFTLVKAAEIKKELHNLTDEESRIIGLSVQDFLDYETKKNTLGKSAFTYLCHIDTLLQKFVSKTILTPVPSVSGLPILSNSYVALNMPIPDEEWGKITSYADYLGLDYIRTKVSPYTALVDVFDKQGDEHNGSGVLISENYILTCAHVVDKMTDIEVVIGDIRYKAVNVYQSQNKDIALIEIENCTLSPENDIILGEGYVLEPIVTLGYPPIPLMKENSLIAQRGEINAIASDYYGYKNLIYSSIVRPGNSGGPIFSENGYMVGMVVEDLEHRNLQNTIHLDKDQPIEKQLESLCEQINGIPPIVPFYSGLTAAEIYEEIKLLKPDLYISHNLK